jgi:hypothetical protein
MKFNDCSLHATDWADIWVFSHDRMQYACDVFLGGFELLGKEYCLLSKIRIDGE